MLESEARKVLRVDASASAAEVRAAFRRLVRQSHPDVLPGDTGASRTTASLVEAYAVLRRASRSSASTASAAPATPACRSARSAEVAGAGDSVVVRHPPAEAYRRLVDIAHLIGEVTYVDPDARLLDTVVITDKGAACSLLASLQGRESGTEIIFSIEPLGGENGPEVQPLVMAIAELFADRG